MTTIDQISNIERTIESSKMNLRMYKNKLRIVRGEIQKAETVGASFAKESERIHIETRINFEETRLHDSRMKAVQLYSNYYQLSTSSNETINN